MQHTAEQHRAVEHAQGSGVEPALTPSRAALVALIARYRELGFRSGSIEAQKLAYLLQEAGEPLNLDFTPHQFGPFDARLDRVLANMNGSILSGFGDEQDGHDLRPTPTALPQARAALDAATGAAIDTARRVDRVARLIEGFESPLGLELLATVHWLARRADPPAASVDEVAPRLVEWGERKARVMPPRFVAKAWHRLASQGWLGAATDGA